MECEERAARVANCPIGIPIQAATLAQRCKEESQTLGRCEPANHSLLINGYSHDQALSHSRFGQVHRLAGDGLRPLARWPGLACPRG